MLKSFPLNQEIEYIKSKTQNPAAIVIIDKHGRLVSHWTNLRITSLPPYLFYTFLHKAYTRAVFVLDNNPLDREEEGKAGIKFDNGNIGIAMSCRNIEKIIPV
jgi:hypothetical protein